VGRFVVVEHYVESVAGGGDEDDLEDCVPGRICEGPEDVWEVLEWRVVREGGLERTEIACYVDEEVECLRLERDAGARLQEVRRERKERGLSLVVRLWIAFFAAE
jgi:hypothetical protein